MNERAMKRGAAPRCAARGLGLAAGLLAMGLWVAAAAAAPKGPKHPRHPSHPLEPAPPAEPAPCEGGLSAFAVSTWSTGAQPDGSTTATSVSFVNPISVAQTVLVAVFDASGAPLSCMAPTLGPNAQLALEIDGGEDAVNGTVKIATVVPDGEGYAPGVGVVGYRSTRTAAAGGGTWTGTGSLAGTYSGTSTFDGDLEATSTGTYMGTSTFEGKLYGEAEYHGEEDGLIDLAGTEMGTLEGFLAAAGPYGGTYEGDSTFVGEYSGTHSMDQVETLIEIVNKIADWVERITNAVMGDPGAIAGTIAGGVTLVGGGIIILLQEQAELTLEQDTVTFVPSDGLVAATQDPALAGEPLQILVKACAGCDDPCTAALDAAPDAVCEVSPTGLLPGQPVSCPITSPSLQTVAALRALPQSFLSRDQNVQPWLDTSDAFFDLTLDAMVAEGNELAGVLAFALSDGLGNDPDGDGVINKYDFCPLDGGAQADHGCPAGTPPRVFGSTVESGALAGTDAEEGTESGSISLEGTFSGTYEGTWEGDGTYTGSHHDGRVDYGSPPPPPGTVITPGDGFEPNVRVRGTDEHAGTYGGSSVGTFSGNDAHSGTFTGTNTIGGSLAFASAAATESPVWAVPTDLLTRDFDGDGAPDELTLLLAMCGLAGAP